MKFQAPESKYYNTKQAKTGDNIEITGEFKMETGKFGDRVVGTVLVNGVPKIFSMKPNSKAHRALMSEFGEDSKDWIHQKASIFVDKTGQFPQIILSPIPKVVDVDNPF